tara:strand:+ start:6205 stop:6648 length:444 start_codon:yes stop_codon:yes gene_type:complete
MLLLILAGTSVVTLALALTLSVLLNWKLPDPDELVFLTVFLAAGVFLRTIIPAVFAWIVASWMVNRYGRERLIYIGAVTFVAVIGWANLASLNFSIFGPGLMGSNAAIAGMWMALPVAIAVGIATLISLYPTKGQTLAGRFSECGSE